MNIERHWDAKVWEAEVTEDMNTNITLVAAEGSIQRGRMWPLERWSG